MMTLYMVKTEPRDKKNFKLRLEASVTYYVSQSVFPIYLIEIHMAVTIVHMRLFQQKEKNLA